MRKGAVIPAPLLLGKRIQQVMLEMGARSGQRVTLDDFGRMVARAEGRKEPYKATTVSGWIHGASEPSLGALDAIARISGRSRAWIAFGEPESQALLVAERPADPLPRDLRKKVEESEAAKPKRRRARG